MSGSVNGPAGIVAVIRTDDPHRATMIATSQLAGGVASVEITFTVPSAAEVIAELAAHHPGRVGAGTVRSVTDVRAAADAGAAYLVAPDTDPSVLAAAADAGLPMVSGGLTPTEITTAYRAGATAVKVFPVGAVGGVNYVRALREPLSDIPLVVSGGIAASDAAAYLELGVQAVCLGAALVDRAALDAGDHDALVRHVRAALAAIHPAPGS